MQKFMDKVQKHLGDHSGQGGSSGGHPQGGPQGGNPGFPLNGPDEPRPVYPQQGQKPPGPGKIPPKVANTRYHDAMRFFHPNGKQHNVLRDLGFSGVLDGRIVWCWGDTLMGTPERNMICAVDSTTIGSMKNPMSSCDSALQPNNEFVRNWIPCNKEEEAGGGYSCYSFGGTNIVEYEPNKGIVYYLKMHRPGGVYKCHGAGVATCSMGQNGIPNATRAGNVLWSDEEPSWGDVGITYNAKDQHIYAYGHGSGRDGELSSRTFLCKVPANRATDVGAYQYWDNSVKNWTSQRFSKGENGTLNCTQQMAIFDWHAMNQSAPFWSNYYNKWMLLHSTGWPDSPVICKTADKLEGPWDDHGEVATTAPGGKADGFRYCVCGHPEFDDTGKTVLVTWTRNNIIYGVTIEWQ